MLDFVVRLGDAPCPGWDVTLGDVAAHDETEAVQIALATIFTGCDAIPPFHVVRCTYYLGGSKHAD